jgi:hypothetical protein
MHHDCFTFVFRVQGTNDVVCEEDEVNREKKKRVCTPNVLSPMFRATSNTDRKLFTLSSNKTPLFAVVSDLTNFVFYVGCHDRGAEKSFRPEQEFSVRLRWLSGCVLLRCGRSQFRVVCNQQGGMTITRVLADFSRLKSMGLNDLLVDLIGFWVIGEILFVFIERFVKK